MNFTESFICPTCGKKHDSKVSDCFIGKGALAHLTDIIIKYNSHMPYVLCDINTYAAAGTNVSALLIESKIDSVLHIINSPEPSPDEKTVGEAVMYCPKNVDFIIGVGGGVINDTCKILAMTKNVPMAIVGTAPSMDGFASATSSVDRSGLKVSLPSKCPDCVIGDTEILASAPIHNIRSGIGDMLAKYVSLAEWKIANILLGEYYCEKVADTMRAALDKCISNAPAAVNHDENAVSSVMEGLTLGGIMMNWAGISRPASGMEHYISHIIDMRALEFGAPHDYHGIECGIATLYTIRMYENLCGVLSKPIDTEKAIKHAESYDLNAHFSYMREKLGRGAEAMISLEAKEGKYSPIKHKERIKTIAAKREEILDVIKTLPKSEELEKTMLSIGLPTKFSEIGLNDDDVKTAVLLARDIRDKYVLGRLLWDLGLTD
jgi:glycerol-1-phosphate dehydrogenase [NAD(P)+]